MALVAILSGLAWAEDPVATASEAETEAERHVRLLAQVSGDPAFVVSSDAEGGFRAAGRDGGLIQAVTLGELVTGDPPPVLVLDAGVLRPELDVPDGVTVHLVDGADHVHPLHPTEEGWELPIAHHVWAALPEDGDLAALERALVDAQAPFLTDTTDVAVIDEDCGALPEVAGSVAEAVTRANAGDVVLVALQAADDGEAGPEEEEPPFPTSEAALDLAEAHDVDLIVVAGDVCDGKAKAERLVAELVSTFVGGRRADVWGWGAGDEGRHLAVPETVGTRLLLDGPGLVAVLRPPVAPPPAALGWALGAGQPSRWVLGVFSVFAVAAVSVFAALFFLGLRKEDRASS